LEGEILNEEFNEKQGVEIGYNFDTKKASLFKFLRLKFKTKNGGKFTEKYYNFNFKVRKHKALQNCNSTQNQKRQTNNLRNLSRAPQRL
jgi:hypothetical protein